MNILDYIDLISLVLHGNLGKFWKNLPCCVLLKKEVVDEWSECFERIKSKLDMALSRSYCNLRNERKKLIRNIKFGL